MMVFAGVPCPCIVNPWAVAPPMRMSVAWVRLYVPGGTLMICGRSGRLGWVFAASIAERREMFPLPSVPVMRFVACVSFVVYTVNIPAGDWTDPANRRKRTMTVVLAFREDLSVRMLPRRIIRNPPPYNFDLRIMRRAHRRRCPPAD